MGSGNFSRNRLLWAAVSVSLGIASGTVLADAPAAASKVQHVTQPSELMTFANVKVVNATPTEVQAVKQPSAQGMRAFVDGNGKLRQQTAEDGQAIAAETKAKQQKIVTKSRARSALASDASSETGVEETYHADGSVSVQVPEDLLVYQTAHKGNGSVTLQETIGKTAADKSARRATQEVSNDR